MQRAFVACDLPPRRFEWTYIACDLDALPALDRLPHADDPSWALETSAGMHTGVDDDGFVWLGASGEMIPYEAATGVVLAQLERLSMSVPPLLTRVLTEPAVRRSIFSPTASYWDLGHPVPNPFGDGVLLRFMTAQQFNFTWLVALGTDGPNPVYAAPPLYAPDNYDGDELPAAFDEALSFDRRGRDALLRGVVRAADDLPQFLMRLRLHGCAWTKLHWGEPLDAMEQAHADAWRHAAAPLWDADD